MNNTHNPLPQTPGLDNAALIDSVKQTAAALIKVNAANDALKQENKDLSERVEALEQANRELLERLKPETTAPAGEGVDLS